MDQQGSSCCHYFLTVTSSYQSKVNLVGISDAEKLAETGFLDVCDVGCPVGRKVEVLEVLRSFGDIFTQKLRLLRRKKTCKDGFD